MGQRSAKDLLPDLPSEEPWLELKFQLRELDRDLKDIHAQLQQWKQRLGQREQAMKLEAAMRDLFFQVDHDAHAHAPRAVQLAQCLLTLPPEAVPEWGDMAGASRAEFGVPEEIMGCRSLEEAQANLAQHLEATLSAVQRAREAALRAAAARGPSRAVLEEVLKEASLCCRLLQEEAWPHAEKTYQWSKPYWRLMDPQAAAEYDSRVAQAEAELESELDREQAGRPPEE